jgi:hypothetical protein
VRYRTAARDRQGEDATVKLTRHARNRLRLIRRATPDITAAAVLSAVMESYDEVVDDRIVVRIGDVDVVVVLDVGRSVLVTLWRQR